MPLGFYRSKPEKRLVKKLIKKLKATAKTAIKGNISTKNDLKRLILHTVDTALKFKYKTQTAIARYKVLPIKGLKLK